MAGVLSTARIVRLEFGWPEMSRDRENGLEREAEREKEEKKLERNEARKRKEISRI